ncbi:MAG TPA: tRNA epoxyqueuosine(34) reductase QueG [Nitrospiria bacterium]|nr:tRNA epoxyqueuosine(34) reductase QueG [Nitrospiria bacterium]
METYTLTQKVKAVALSIGFDLVGVAVAEPLIEEGERLHTWLSEGRHGEMAYMAREPERRADPCALMPEARSVISLGLNYYQDPGQNSGPRVARYAFGEDYHRIIEEKLAALVAFIEGVGGRCARGRGDVDHGPLMERALARRTGLGFVGKNTNLITRKFGSWVFLAEVITDLELVPDPAVSFQANGCGECRLCLDACPTGALTEAYQLDARRCIAYLTIEQKGSIPKTFRPLVGEWAFGCDLCQEVCPYNWNPVETAEERLQSNHGIGSRLSGAFLSSDQFKKKFAETPLSRAKRKGLLRNLAVALGNVGRWEDLRPLFMMLDDPEPLVREHAAWGILEIVRREGPTDREEVERAIEERLEREGDPSVRASLQEIILHINEAA